jgi:hypothetical protein
MKNLLKLVIVAFSVITLTNSCVKQTDCKLTVTTVDSAGNKLGSAIVKLYANVKTQSGTTVEADLKAEGVSDSQGSSIYTFKLPAILDVKAVLGNKVGTGIIKLEEGKSVEKTITVK